MAGAGRTSVGGFYAAKRESEHTISARMVREGAREYVTPAKIQEERTGIPVGGN